MLLAIDVGNTNTLFAVYKDDTLLQSWRCRTVAERSGDEYAVFFHKLCDVAGIALKNVDDVIVSSVVPDANMHIEKFAAKYLKREARIIGKDHVPIEIDLLNPDEVGADRLVNALAIKSHYAMPAVVVDFGTATTFDVISLDGGYMGGVIAPGVHLSLDALNRAAAKLPKVNVEKPAKVIGKSTIQAMQSGIYFGYQGMIEGILKTIEGELGQKPFVLATGGLAPLFADGMEAIDQVDEELTLKGLLEIYKEIKN